MINIIISIVLIISYTSCNPINSGPFEASLSPLDSCKGHKSNGFFVDPKDHRMFHLCSNGELIGSYVCPVDRIFDERLDTCVEEIECKESNGLFADPNDVHKFIVCSGGHGFIADCEHNYVFDESLRQCVFQDQESTTSSTYYPDDSTTEEPRSTTEYPTTYYRTTTDESRSTTEYPTTYYRTTTEEPRSTTE